MSNYLICTSSQYIAGVTLTENISKHDPVFSPDGEEVLVKGAGNMSLEEAKQYIADNWPIVEDE